MSSDRSATVTAPALPRRGGWWHAYVCPVHHTELLEPPAQLPGEDDDDRHRCPHGCELAGEPFSSAALVYRYQGAARRLRVLARRAAAGDRPAADDARELARALLQLHEQAAGGAWNEEAAPWMLRGKLFHQALTEAIWVTNVAHGLRTLRDAGLSDDDLDAQVVPFAATACDNALEAREVLIHGRNEFSHNYTAWLNAAGAATAWLLGGDSAREPWLEEEVGVYRHVLAVVGGDGWEWEAATYYHVFVLRAYLLSLRGLQPDRIPADVVAALARMLAVLPAVAAPGGRLPALHDSPYARRVSSQEIAEVVALGRQLVAVPGLSPVHEHARAQLGLADDGLDRHLDGWFPGTAADPPAQLVAPDASHAFTDAGYTILRSPDGRWRALLDHGPHGGAHGHLDKLALYVEGTAAWQPDPGITPYASDLRAHYASTLAHPTFRVDGRDQQECSGRLERFDVHDGVITVIASADDAYPGIRARRTLHLHADWLVDIVDLRADRGAAAGPTDADQARQLTLQFRPAVPVTLAAGDAGAFRVLWHDPTGDLTTWHVADTATAVRPIPLPGPADDPMRTVTGVDWTGHGHHTRFCTVWQPASASDPVLAVHLEDGEVVVRAASGDHRHPL